LKHTAPLTWPLLALRLPSFRLPSFRLPSFRLLAVLTALLSLAACSPSSPSAAPDIAAQAVSTATLPINTYRSLQVLTPGFTNRTLRQTAGLAFTEIVSGASAQGLRQDASFRIVRGLGDANCYSLESQNLRGQYLRHQNSRVKLSASDGSAVFNADATFCARPGLSGSGISLESLNFPGRFLRHFNAEVWLAQSGGPLPSDAAGNFNPDASWNLITAWNRSGVALPSALQSWQVTNPGLTERFLRHQASLGYTSPVSAASDTVTRADATWRIVPGLADAGCYSFEASNIAGSYLRSSAFRLRIDPNDNGAQFKADATFCTQPGLSGAGVSLEAYALSGQFIRHAGGELWLASGAGARPSDGAASFAPDVSWGLAAPWSTGIVNPPPPPPGGAGSINSIPASSIPAPAGAGVMALRLLNGTGGVYADSNIYWAVLGINPANNRWSYLDLGGNLQPMSTALNDAGGHLVKNGVNYANIYNRVSDATWASIPRITAGRLYVCVGSPCYIKTFDSGFAGPNVDNSADPNINVYFDFVEFTVDATGYHGNTTRVDGFGFPFQHRLVGKSGYDRTVGEPENETRDGIFNAYRAQVPGVFSHLAIIQAPYRIVAPIHGDFRTGGSQGAYFDSYVNSVWTNGTRPNTQQVLLCNGPLATDAGGCAGLNRHVYADRNSWSNVGAYYLAGPANYYAQFWHNHALGGLAYGFAYDDYNGQAAYLEVGDPKGLILRVGW
jgi:Alpha-L-arabinofuranosidase B (ABFB) domain/Beta-1,3-glucanase